MTVGLISDTHGVFSQEFREFLEPVDELWHAGDWGGDDSFVQSIKDFKPVVGVYGNCDGLPARYDFPEFQSFEREGLKVLMTHIGGYPGHYNPVARRVIMEERPGLFVCGHSHILKVQWDEKFGMLTMNPGAAGLQGWQVVRTALRFKIADGAVSGLEVFELPRTGGGQLAGY